MLLRGHGVAPERRVRCAEIAQGIGSVALVNLSSLLLSAALSDAQSNHRRRRLKRQDLVRPIRSLCMYNPTPCPSPARGGCRSANHTAGNQPNRMSTNASASFPGVTWRSIQLTFHRPGPSSHPRATPSTVSSDMPIGLLFDLVTKSLRQNESTFAGNALASQHHRPRPEDLTHVSKSPWKKSSTDDVRVSRSKLSALRTVCQAAGSRSGIGSGRQFSSAASRDDFMAKGCMPVST